MRATLIKRRGEAAAGIDSPVGFGYWSGSW
jgi:hypothetical protein